MLSLATGWPNPSTYPTAQLAKIAAEVFAEEGDATLSFLPADGLYALREQVAKRGRRLGFATDPDEIVVTSGAQQGLRLAVEAVLQPGDVAVTESPTFIGALAALRASGARVIGLPVDEDGLDVDALERMLARHEVKLVSLQPACQNPTGRDLSPERARRLAELAVERNFFVLEDQVYADTRIDGERGPGLRELAPAHVIHVNSLSKVIGPGLRVGWLAARGPIRERMVMAKLLSDFHTPTLTQHMASRWLASGAHDRHVKRSLPFYRERRDAMLAALERHLPGEHRRSIPRGAAPRVGHPHPPARRARPLLGGRAARRDLHPGRSGDRRAALPDRPAPLLSAARSRGAGRGREAAVAGHARGARAVRATRWPRRSPRRGPAAYWPPVRRQTSPRWRSSRRESGPRKRLRTPSRWVTRARSNSERPRGVITA